MIVIYLNSSLFGIVSQASPADLAYFKQYESALLVTHNLKPFMVNLNNSNIRLNSVIYY